MRGGAAAGLPTNYSTATSDKQQTTKLQFERATTLVRRPLFTYAANRTFNNYFLPYEYFVLLEDNNTQTKTLVKKLDISKEYEVLFYECEQYSSFQEKGIDLVNYFRINRD